MFRLAVVARASGATKYISIHAFPKVYQQLLNGLDANYPYMGIFEIKNDVDSTPH